MANRKELEALIKLSGKIDPSLKKAMQESAKLSDKTSKNVGSLGSVATKTMKLVKTAAVTVGVGIGTAGAALIKTTNDTMKYADVIDKMSIRTGLSYEELQKLEYITGQVGVNFESVGSSIAFLTKNLESARTKGSDLNKVYTQIGIDPGKIKNQGELFSKTVAALSQVSDETERNMIASKLFGRSYAELIPLFDAGVDGLQELSAQAVKNGLIMSDDMIKTSVIAADKIDLLTKSFRGIGFNIVEKVIPYVEQFASYLIANMPSIQSGVDNFAGGLEKAIDFTADLFTKGVKLYSFLANNWDQVEPMIWGIVAAMVSWKAITLGIAIYQGIMAGVKAGTIAATIAQWGLNAAVLANPMTWVIIGIAAAIGALVAMGVYLYKNWDRITEKGRELWSQLSAIFSGIGQAIGGAFKFGMNVAIVAINKIIKAANMLNFKIPDWVPVIGGKQVGFNIKEFPLFAKGGLATGPSIFGEAGPEMAIPVKRTPRSISLLNKTAQMLGVSNESKGDSPTFVYAPNYYGGSPDKDTEKRQFEDFKSMCDDWWESKRRESLA